jgi:hypothetical protein
MSYRVEYNGGDIEVMTLDAALENAKNAIAADIGPISGWTVEHDETINDWFVQGVIDGTPVGSTAVISGPEEMIAAPAVPQLGGQADGWVERVSFTGMTAADAFATATNWLAGRASVVTVSDVSWQPIPGGYQLRLYFTSGPSRVESRRR